MRAGFEAMRLGAIIYFVPFFFVFNPALLLQGSIIENLQAFTTAIFGVAIVSGALQGYMIGVGDLSSGIKGLVVKILVGMSGLMLALPAGGLFGFSQIALLAVAVGFLVSGIVARKVLISSQ